MYERASDLDCASRGAPKKNPSSNAHPIDDGDVVLRSGNCCLVNNEVDDDSTPFRPFTLCTALLRNW